MDTAKEASSQSLFTGITVEKLNEVQLKRKEVLKIVLELQKLQQQSTNGEGEKQDGEGRPLLLSKSGPNSPFHVRCQATTGADSRRGGWLLRSPLHEQLSTARAGCGE